MTFPAALLSSKLFQQLSQDSDLAATVDSLRQTAEYLAETIARDVPSFTDHSIRHMDALWLVAEKVLSNQEIQRLSAAEAFLLTTGFYLHDIGMAYAATAEGRSRLQQTTEYLASISAAPLEAQNSPDVIGRALAMAVRAKHAQAAEELAVGQIPGTTQFLIEPRLIREQFGITCGRIAASHHWSIDRVEAELGHQDRVPLANSRSADLAFVACALRLIDYAHINRDRAPRLARDLRSTLFADSAVHWNAQQDIDGPERVANELSYRTAIPITDVDAWWLYFDLLKGLDSEIRKVHAFLGRRSVSAGRLSLIGVRGADSPGSAAKFIQTAGFLPLEVGVRASSITRLVRILAGESLYGKNFMAPVRELIQNSVDATLLKKSVAKSEADVALAQLPIKLRFDQSCSPNTLSVKDWGIGMSAKVISEHLLTIASDYWEGQYHFDFPGGAGDFKPTGRFGIGFLSVFMLGDAVQVESEKLGEPRHSLTIRGLGRRAELRETKLTGYSGTEVFVSLKQEAAAALSNFESLCRSFFPLLSVPLEITAGTNHISLTPNWLLSEPPAELKTWVEVTAKLLSEAGTQPDDIFRRDRFFGRRYPWEQRNNDSWIANPPEYLERGVRLLADRAGISIISLRGFSLQAISTPGFIGIIDSDQITPDASRRHGLDIDISPLMERAILASRPGIIENLNVIGDREFFSSKLDILTWCANTYGDETISSSRFKFVQLLTKDGTSRYVDAATLFELARTEKAFYLGLNFGANGIAKDWQRRYANDSEYALCFPEGFSIRYLADEQVRGTLHECCPDFERNTLLKVCLQTIASSWGVDALAFGHSPDWTHWASNVAGVLRKPSS